MGGYCPYNTVSPDEAFYAVELRFRHDSVPSLRLLYRSRLDAERSACWHALEMRRADVSRVGDGRDVLVKLKRLKGGAGGSCREWVSLLRHDRESLSAFSPVLVTDGLGGEEDLFR